jgi:hypothetical protein
VEELRQGDDLALLPGDGSVCAEIVLLLVTHTSTASPGQTIGVDGGTVWNQGIEIRDRSSREANAGPLTKSKSTLSRVTSPVGDKVKA